MKRRYWLLTLLFCWLALAARAAEPLPADRIVAVVNDEVITLQELRGRAGQIERQLQQQKTPLPPRDVLERQVLERMIVDRAQLQFARETGVRVDDGQLDAALERIAQSNRIPLADFRAAIERDGLPWPKFREEIRNEIIIARVREREVDNRISVSEGEIENYLANPRSAAAEELLVSHILLRVPEQASPEQLQRLRTRAEEALSQLRLGADFGQVAASYSDAPDAMTGGSLGWRAPERLPALFAEAVAKLSPGGVSPVLRSPAGFHILKLMERRGGAPTTAQVQQTHARHILIKPSEILSEDEARRRLVGLRERLVNGADFAELARLHSHDGTAAKGGDLGWVYPGDTVPQFERAMDALKPGELSEPVQTPFGWHLIQVLERRVQDVSADRQRLLARAAIRERKSDEAYQEWLRQLRDRAYVELRLEER